MAREKFEGVFAHIRSELIDHISAEGLPKEATDWYADVSAAPLPFGVPSCAYSVQNLDYNVPGGKLNRGLSVVDSLEILKRRTLTDAEYDKAAILGWCVELVGSVSSSTGSYVPVLRWHSYKRSS